MPKGRAGGGDPRRGSQSAARPGGAAARARPQLQNCKSTSRISNLKAIICTRYLQITKCESFYPPIIPPGAPRIPPGRLKNDVPHRLMSIKNLHRFLHRILLAFGLLLGSLLAPFSLPKSSHVVFGNRVFVGGFSLKMDIGPLLNPT